MKSLVRILLGAGSVLAAAAPAGASQQVYRFVSPTFGGNPLNGTFLLSTAQAQGFGAKSNQNTPDLSGLSNALSDLGNGLSSGVSGGGTSVATPIIVIPGTSTSAGTIP